MNENKLAELLAEKQVVTDAQVESIKTANAGRLFSIHWELKSLLYLGITLLSSGLGVVIYENIDTIGHSVLIGLTAAVCIACFYFAFKHRKPFAWGEITQNTNLADFALLGGCLAFLTLEGYLQYQYNIFGSRYGIAALIPAILFFGLAYLFDHRGVLSMAITALASSIGVSIVPVRMWENFDFDSHRLIINALILGILLTAVGWFSEQKSLKKHFLFTYLLFGGNMAFAAALAGLFTLKFKLIYLLITLALSAVFIMYARRKQSYLYILMGVIYGYIALTYMIFHLIKDEWLFEYISIYFMFSAGLVILFLLKVKEFVKAEK